MAANEIGDFENYFTCVGPTRSGTSWLHAYLRKHSTAHMTVMKEVSWFNVATGIRDADAKVMLHQKWQARMADLKANQRENIPYYSELADRDAMRTDADYRRFFTDRVESGQVFGDITPGYSRLESEGFARITTTFPKAKFVLLLRNPTDRLWSQASRPAFIGTDLSQMEFVARKLAASWPFTQVYKTYQNIRSHVPADRIKCIFTEDLFSSNADTALQDLCQFLNIEGAPVDNHTHTRNGIEYLKMPDDIRAIAAQTFAPTYRWAQEHMPRLPAKWQADIDAYL